eukprot:599294-Pleurochrysis_carterae.AAC.1
MRSTATDLSVNASAMKGSQLMTLASDRSQALAVIAAALHSGSSYVPGVTLAFELARSAIGFPIKSGGQPPSCRFPDLRDPTASCKILRASGVQCKPVDSYPDGA